MPRRDQLFETITTEGALLPSDFLQRLAQRDRDLDGLSVDDYHLGGGEKLNEAISRSWNRLLGVWKNFAAAATTLPSSDLGTTLTREKWLLPLFQELGYGRLATAKPFEFADRKYSISHLWQNTPIHLVSFRADLDVRSENIVGARKSTPHSMVQEFLNRSTPHLWAIVSNGFNLRLLRDNSSLIRQAYIEFDLQAMMAGEVYADFALLWLLLHQSRVEGDRPELCWLEKWTQEARQQGERALDHMREGVQDAITALGQGFLAHPANGILRARLRSGELTAQDYFRQLLRVVYRLLFLCIAEDRDLLHAADVTAKTRENYRSHYSLTRLRRVAQRLGGTQHSDLWHIAQLIVRSLGSKEGCPSLGLPALGSFLWSEQATSALDGCQLSNRHLLQAIRSLAFSQQGRFRRPVDYKNIGSPEFGSVYESLLEQHPRLNLDAATFTLDTHAGNERKTSGSHYTPPPLVNCLLDSALDPVLRERERDFAKLGFKSAEDAILSIKVCDKAVGSGHFLVAAAHRIAKRLASIRTGEEEPAPGPLRHALRDVIGRCLYGVDINPMAVELCKFALWLEALEPGKPLSFLDHHIQCGNSLLGATPALMAQGIPDAAFEPIEGDDKKYCSQFKKANREEAEGQLMLTSGLFKPWEHLGNLATNIAQIASLPDDRLEDVQAKEQKYTELVRSTGYEFGRQLADAWCAAFVWKKCATSAGGFDYPITNEVFRRLERNPHDAPKWMRDEIKRLADQYQFFHWHLTFPDVFQVPPAGKRPENELCGWSGGFDVILGNPPWVRQESLANLKRLLTIWPSFSSTADLSVFFIDLANAIASGNGRVGLLTPNKWLRNKYGENLRSLLNRTSRIHLIIDLGHSRDLFKGIDTFPAIVVLQPRQNRDPNYSFKFVVMNEDERRDSSLSAVIEHKQIEIPASALQGHVWNLEDSDSTKLLGRLSCFGKPLGQLLNSPIRRGVNTGYNDAFLITHEQKLTLEQVEPECASIIYPWAGGSDVNRWVYTPSGTYVIFTRRGVDISKFPAVEQHLAKFREQLTPKKTTSQSGPGRKPGPYQWYEIQDNTAYFQEFSRPKLLVPTILYYNDFAFVRDTAYPSSKVNVIPTSDLAILSVLNSRVMWWIMHRRFVGMKDDAISAEVNGLNELPIPEIGGKERCILEESVARLMEIGSGGSPIEAFDLEARIDTVVNELFQVTKEELDVIKRSEPPRDPLTVAEKRKVAASPASIAAPTWLDRPLVLPAIRRVALIPDRYRAALVPHLLYQSGGSLPFERFRKAYWLLTEPKTLGQYATGAVGEVAQQWSRQFRDTLQKDMFVQHLKGAVGRQLHFIRKGDERWLELRDAKVANDEHVIFDARLALLVADLWPVTEPIAPLAPEDEIAIQQLEAVL